MQRTLFMTALATVVIASLAEAQVASGYGVPNAGPPLVGGWADGHGNAIALAVSDTLRLDAGSLPGIAAVGLGDEAGVLEHGGIEPAAVLRISVPQDLVYAVVELVLVSEDPAAASPDLHWMGSAPATASLWLELYRGDRADVAAWLASASERARPEAATRCPPSENPRPVYVVAVDLDGDGQREGLTTLASTPIPDWFCRWTEIHTTGAAPVTLGLAPHGWPSVRDVERTRTDGSRARLVETRFECCDLDQTFMVMELRGGALVTLFDNNALPGGGSGFALGGEAEDGVFELAVTPDQAAYNYGEPRSRDGFVRYRLEADGFRQLAGDDAGITPAGEGEPCGEGCAEGLTCCYPCGIQGCTNVCMGPDLAPDGNCPRYP